MSEKKQHSQVYDQTLQKKLKMTKQGSKLNNLPTKGVIIMKQKLSNQQYLKSQLNYSTNTGIQGLENPCESKSNLSVKQKAVQSEVSRSDSDNKNQNTTLPLLTSYTTKEVKSSSKTKGKTKLLLNSQFKIQSPTPTSSINKSISKIYAENKDSLQNLHNNGNNNSNSNISTNYGRNKKYVFVKGKFLGEAVKGVGRTSYNNPQQPNAGSKSKPKSVNKNINNINSSKLNASISNVLARSNIKKTSNKSMNLTSEGKIMTIQSNINYNVNLQNFKLPGTIGNGSNIQRNPTDSQIIQGKDNLNRLKNVGNTANNNKLQPNNKFKDDRKFSILDIPASAMPLIKAESNSNNANNYCRNENMEDLCSYQNTNHQEDIIGNNIVNELPLKNKSSNNIQKINFNNDEVFGFIPMNPFNYGNFQGHYNNMNQQQNIDINCEGNMSGTFNFKVPSQNVPFGGFVQSDKNMPLNTLSTNQLQNTQQSNPQLVMKGELIGNNTGPFNQNHTYSVGWQGNYLNQNIGHHNSNTLCNLSQLNHMNSTTQSNYITVTNNDESQFYSTLISELHMRKSISKSKKNFSALKTSSLKAFFLMLESEFLVPNLKLKMITTVKPIYEISKETLLKDHITSLIKAVKQLDEKYPDPIKNKLRDEIANWVFKPSATSQLSLNHLTKKSEKIFSSLRMKYKEIDALFRVILLVFNVSESYNFDNTLLTLYSKFKVDGLSKLYIYHINF